ncbi:LD-carboxypeptidase [Kitasatospora sp. NPDC058048]|uniref:S66 peptidase family protein n=1 Tax=Kitasatospora sp. NPDC058048 TaxID=3346313 RepID=UPI0036DBD182
MSTAPTALLLPRALRPGDLVAVAAPSGPLDTDARPFLARGTAVLEELGFRVRVCPSVAEGRRHWWAAARPAEQAAEFNALLRDPEVRAVVAHTGGQAVTGWLDQVDLDAVRADPKPVLGCSDVSQLLLALHARTGLVGVHADMATYGLGGSWSERFAGGPGQRPEEDGARRALREAYLRVLTAPVPPGALPALSPWQCWRAGRARGPLIGGLLNRLVALQATPYAVPAGRFDGAVLFWEEVDRPLSAVWSDLHALRLSGVLDRIAAMVVGTPHRVGAADGTEPSLREVVLDVLGPRPLPVLAGVDLGHAGPNLPLPLGVRAEADATARTLTLLTPAVR